MLYYLLVKVFKFLTTYTHDDSPRTYVRTIKHWLSSNKVDLFNLKIVSNCRTIVENHPVIEHPPVIEHRSQMI